MNQKTSDSELNKAALVIAKLLILTRDGKIIWHAASSLPVGTVVHAYITPLEDKVEAVITRTEEALKFELVGRPFVDEYSNVHNFGNEKPILSIALAHSHGQQGRVSPESIVYADLEELFALAKDPKSVSSDVQIRQVMDYLDRLAG